MPKVAILHPGIYGNPKNDALTTSFLADVTVVQYTAGMTKEELLAAIPAGLTHLSFIYHYPGYSRLPFFADRSGISSVSGEKPKYRYFSDTVIDILRSVSSVDRLTVDILSCNLNEAAYAEEVKKIETDLGINIRFSVDKTGNPSSGANWTLESEEPAVSVRSTYFTDGVLAWNGMLAGDISQAIKAGLGNCATYITWNAPTFKVKKNFAWIDISFNGSSVTGEDYIELSGNEIFDGSNYAIDISDQPAWEGLITSSATSFATAPLIKNLGVTGGVMISAGGAIVRGSQRFFRIQNCSSTGAISFENAGGIAGAYAGSFGGVCTITNCHSEGAISGKNAGGIAGSYGAFSAFSGSGSCIITNCYSIGTISGVGAGGIAGGYAGSYDGVCTITNCYNTGDISGNNAGGIAGGYAGTSSGSCTITNCYSTGTIIGVGAGGIAGDNIGAGGSCIIITCYSSGDISGNNAGGIAGSFAGIFASGTRGLCEITNCYSIGTIRGGDAGGIAGAFAGAFAGATRGLCAITNCYSAGTISGVGSGGIAGNKTGVGGGLCTITCCVCNNTPIIGSGAATITNSSTNLSVINNNIYLCWIPSSVWMPGGPVEPTDYNLPILKPFRNSPWNSDFYEKADDAAQFGVPVPQNTFPLRVNPFITLGRLLVYRQDAMDALVASLPLLFTSRVSWAPFGLLTGSLLRDLQQTVVVQVSPTNPLHVYRFQKIQLIRGPTSEGAGGSPIDIDAWLTGYICVWSADGVAPVFP